MNPESGPTYCQNIVCRWKTYGVYRLIIWAWMMNETSMAWTPADISHSGFYISALIHLLTVIFIGIPLVYSEICLAQYTNYDVVSMWNFFPILKGFGYGTMFLATLKAIYTMVLATWYLVYTFHSLADPPPWFTCNDFNKTQCMVKRVNISLFQHCLETQVLFDNDCGIKTASYHFFAREIENNNTTIWPRCMDQWKLIIANGSICLALFILSLKKYKYIQVLVKLLVVYLLIVVFVLFWVALSTNGTWYATKIVSDWSSFESHDMLERLFNSFTQGFLAVGTGYGVIGFLSRDVSFRSPATMTSIATSLFSVVVTIMFALIAFSGIKTMSYYHGEEDSIIEVATHPFFNQFASITELLSYFDGWPVWAFAWYSAVFWCLFVNLSILYIYLNDFFLGSFKSASGKNKWCGALTIAFLYILCLPFFCSDLTPALTYVTETLLIINNLIFSVALYWIYGFRKHNVDIIFMIGIKASYFWKITWVLNPIILLIILYSRWATFSRSIYKVYEKTCFVSKITCDKFLVWLFISIYLFIVLICLTIQLMTHYRFKIIHDLFHPTEDWGPNDMTLFKSRKMFVPEIMTREFLYRQVRICNYTKKEITANKRDTESKSFSVPSSEMLY